jgi:HlyD family secretion protein
MRVPTAALVEGNKLYVASSDEGTLDLREVETGLSNWEYTEIQSNVTTSDRIVLSIEREGLTQGVQVISESETDTAK